MSAQDWLVALDDAFTVRLTHCTVCGRRATGAYFDIWTSATMQLHLGWELVERLPEVLARLERGVLDLPRARIFLKIEDQEVVFFLLREL